MLNNRSTSKYIHCVCQENKCAQRQNSVLLCLSFTSYLLGYHDLLLHQIQREFYSVCWSIMFCDSVSIIGNMFVNFLMINSRVIYTRLIGNFIIYIILNFYFWNGNEIAFNK